jgi:DNA segregation ATPase FtsK/SpoIIIE, S-DNA-T family
MSTNRPTPEWWVLNEAGPDAGAITRVPVNGVSIGRTTGVPIDFETEVHSSASRHDQFGINDPSVSRRHLEVSSPALTGGPVVTSLESTNVTLSSGAVLCGSIAAPTTLRLGATILSVCIQPELARVAALGPPRSGRRTFHRPPRPISASSLLAIRVPPARPEVRHASRLGVTALLAPIAIGGVLAILVNPQLALLALTSPVLMLGNWIEDRKRVKRETTTGQRSTEADLAQFAADLATSATTIRIDLDNAFPGVGTLALRAKLPTVELWERRLTHHDCGLLTLGRGSRHLPHPLADPRNDWLPGSHELLSGHTVADDLPILISLFGGAVVGLSGPRSSTADVARSLLCQAMVLHGPADLDIVIITDSRGFPDWKWAAASPHTGPVGAPSIATTAIGADEIVSKLKQELGRWTIILVDVTDPSSHQKLRDLIDEPPTNIAILALGDRPDRLPNNSTTVVEVDRLSAKLRRIELRKRGDESGHHPPHITADQRCDAEVVPTGCSRSTAAKIANDLSGYLDAAETRSELTLPTQARLGDILASGTPIDPVVAMLKRWETAHRARPAAPFALSADGAVWIDLANDGPHGLIAGTTGSGKSELLRTYIASLAAHHPPTLLTFVLVDYKGGAAFDALARLPHVVGMVTDLDVGLGQRALRCLEAELRFREHVLHDAGADDIVAYNGQQPLPRLVVVIDEFATMAADLPDFIPALVGIAQRGRSLGVHLILATQRPAGAVNDSIRANMNLRISLRVQSTADSADVLGVPDAAFIDRQSPGRALLRTGHSELRMVQTASSTLSKSTQESNDCDETPITIEEVAARTLRRASEPTSDEPTDLCVLVDAAIEAHRARGGQPPRRPWPEHLPLLLKSIDLPRSHVLLADFPDTQRQESSSPSLLTSNVVFIGSPQSGAEQAQVATLVALTEAMPANDLHIYILDFGSQILGALGDRPHVGAAITPNEASRFHRLVRQLTRTIAERREHVHAGNSELSIDAPHIVLAIDNWAALRITHDDLAGGGSLEALQRVIADGPHFGVTTIMTVDRPGALSATMSSSFPVRFAFELVDAMDDSLLGIPRNAPVRTNPGRALDLRSMTEVQFALGDGTHSPDTPETMWTGPTRPGRAPFPVPVLPAVVAYQRPSALDRSTSDAPSDAGLLTVRFAVGDDDLETVGWELAEGEHGVISGPAGTGKTSALATIGRAALDTTPSLTIHALCGRRKGLLELIPAQHHTTTVGLRQTVTGFGHQREFEEPHLILIDDAEFVDDEADSLSALIAERRSHLWIVATARPEAMRSGYGHFTSALRKSRQGFALRPQLQIDGELWMTPLPRRRPADEAFPPGRGFLIRDGRAELAQIMVNLDDRWREAKMTTSSGTRRIES